MSAGRYQHTPRASKRNAFCWESWESDAEWGSTQATADRQAARSKLIEDKRASGVDPLHVAGLSSRLGADPKRYAVKLPGSLR